MDIELFVKTELGDPDKGAFEAPANYEELVALLEDFRNKLWIDMMQNSEDTVRNAACMEIMFNYVNFRRHPRCAQMPFPTTETKIMTGIRAGKPAHLLAILEEYMDARPETFGKLVLKIDKNE